MTWVTYSLIAAAATAVIGILDKMVLSKWMADPIGSYFVFGAVELASGLVAFFVLGRPVLPPIQALTALLAGAAFAASSLCYFRAIKVEEISRVIPLYSLSPLFVAILSALFLKEVFRPGQYLGVLLLVLGAALLSLKSLRGWKFGRGLHWMLLAVALISVGSVASKHVLAAADPWTVFAYGKLGTLAATLPLAAAGWRGLRSALKANGPRVLLFTGLSEGLTSITTIFILYAAAAGYVTLVNALVGTQPFFLLLFTALLSLYRPDILREELNGGLIARKLAALAAMAAGAWLIT